ncbi:hypothetical protein NVP1031O_117 [Vibrio phage 1.031.O._10N.261.46.F8]|nr:hypothetical protein NVP1031O_117 [Vibrio phage 1.031.O._10N.261.46.F8]
MTTNKLAVESIPVSKDDFEFWCTTVMPYRSSDEVRGQIALIFYNSGVFNSERSYGENYNDLTPTERVRITKIIRQGTTPSES